MYLRTTGRQELASLWGANDKGPKFGTYSDGGF